MVVCNVKNPFWLIQNLSFPLLSTLGTVLILEVSAGSLAAARPTECTICTISELKTRATAIHLLVEHNPGKVVVTLLLDVVLNIGKNVEVNDTLIISLLKLRSTQTVFIVLVDHFHSNYKCMLSQGWQTKAERGGFVRLLESGKSR